MTYEILNPESLGAPRGWNHGMLAPRGGRLLFIAGQTASDGSGEVNLPDVADQWQRALENAVAVVREAGGSPEDIGQLTIFVTDREEYLENLKPVGAAYRRVMGRHFPAMALVEVAGLVEDGAKVEIQGMALIS